MKHFHIALYSCLKRQKINVKEAEVDPLKKTLATSYVKNEMVVIYLWQEPLFTCCVCSLSCSVHLDMWKSNVSTFGKRPFAILEQQKSWDPCSSLILVSIGLLIMSGDAKIKRSLFQLDTGICWLIYHVLLWHSNVIASVDRYEKHPFQESFS